MTNTDNDDDDETYRIDRCFLKSGRETILTGLTLDEAQAHCEDPETSSRTAVGPDMVALTERRGPWFDAYYRE